MPSITMIPAAIGTASAPRAGARQDLGMDQLRLEINDLSTPPDRDAIVVTLRGWRGRNTIGLFGVYVPGLEFATWDPHGSTPWQRQRAIAEALAEAVRAADADGELRAEWALETQFFNVPFAVIRQHLEGQFHPLKDFKIGAEV